MAFVVGLYVALGLGLVGVAIPMARRKVRPNPVYGFRTPSTLRDPPLWYDVNEYAGRMLVRAGVTIVAVAVAAMPVALFSTEAYTLLCALVMIGGLAMSTVASFRYLRERRGAR
jgi:uncharacterized membrane protein